MRIDQRQRARRNADRRRPLYRIAMWCCIGSAYAASCAAGEFANDGIPFAATLMAVFVAIVTAYAAHFDNESRRTY